MKAYIGVASARGLETLLPEQGLVVQALVARATQRRSVCCWAVLPDSDAREIRYRLADGEQAAALALLEASAREVGSILPAEQNSDREAN